MKKSINSMETGESIFYWSRVIIIGVLVGISAQFVVAWVEPPSSPPNGNIGAPINTSNIGQTKTGAIDINNPGDPAGYSIYTEEAITTASNVMAGGVVCDRNGCIGAGGSPWSVNGSSVYYNSGNVGIGTNNPVQKLDISGHLRVTGDIDARDLHSIRYVHGDFGRIIQSTDEWLRLNQDSSHTSGVYTPTAMRADGGFQVDGKVMISPNASNHSAQYVDNTHYGYFNVKKANGTRGAFFGYGNGGNAVQIYADAASYIDIQGGHLRLRNLANCGGKLVTNANGQIYCAADQTGAGSGINLSGCYDAYSQNDGWAMCNPGYVVTGIRVVGIGCGGECVSNYARCCRATE